MAGWGKLTKRQRVSPTMHAAPLRNALILFDGTSLDQFDGAKLTADGLLEVGAVTRVSVHDFRLHLEFRLPYMPYATGQGRGNSGVYIQQRYEVQVLDSFGLEGVANECGGLYRQQAPDVNMCLPPLVWQTYDIWFTAARFDDAGNKIANARITLVHNGVAVHNQREILAKTGAGKPEGPEWLPILLQNHNNSVRFRNIWIVLEPEAKKAAPCRKPARCRPLRSLLSRCVADDEDRQAALPNLRGGTRLDLSIDGTAVAGQVRASLGDHQGSGTQRRWRDRARGA